MLTLANDGRGVYTCYELDGSEGTPANKAAILCWPLSTFEANEAEKLREVEEYKALPVFAP